MKILYKGSILFLLFLGLGFCFGQQVNPATQIRWGVGVHCGTSGYTWSPAAEDCIAAGGAAYGWVNQVASPQSSSATTLVLNTTVANYPASGTLSVDGEWESWSGVNAATNTLTGMTRGVNQTTAAAHNDAATVWSVDISFAPASQYPVGGVFGGAGGVQGQATSLNCGFPATYNDAGATPVLNINCGSSQFSVDSAGRIHQSALANIANFMSPIYIGNSAVDVPGNIGLPIPILNTTNVAQTNGAYEFSQPIGFQSGVAGILQSNAIANIPAPTLNGQTGGSCSITYEVVGTTSDGLTIPGTTATATSLSFPSAGIVYIQTPLVAGIVTYNVYRTAVSSCGSMTIGKFVSAQNSQYPQFIDTGGAGDGTTPPSTNTSIAKVCTSGGSGFCETSGTGTTANFTCSSSTRSWVYRNTAATATPFAYVCNGTSFVTAY